MASSAQQAWWWAQDYAWAAVAAAATVAAPASPEVYARGTGRPVLVMPGLFENWRFVRPLIQHLHRCGHPVHVVDELGANKLPISASAALVLNTLHHRGLAQVTLVAHSKSGLTGKLAMLRDQEHRITDMIALCTPFAGSSLASLLTIGGASELAPDAELIRSLAEQHQVDHRITAMSVLFDQHVPEVTRLPGARNVTLPFTGHFRATAHPAALEAITAALCHPAS